MAPVIVPSVLSTVATTVSPVASVPNSGAVKEAVAVPVATSGMIALMNVE